MSRFDKPSHQVIAGLYQPSEDSPQPSSRRTPVACSIRRREPGTGKSHLATGLAVAACRQRRRVPFITAAALVNQLVEAQRDQTLSRMLARWARIELIVLDELGYVPLAEVAAELLFQIIADRAEKAAIIVTTNLPFSEWPQVFANARLCKAVLDRLTDQAHIIETGSESYRFRRTRSNKQKQSSINTMSPQ